MLAKCSAQMPNVRQRGLRNLPAPYDRNSWITRVEDNTWSCQSVDYTNDELGRLVEADRGYLSGGGITPTVIDVITANEDVPHNADADLGITLTPLAETLAKILAGRPTT